MRKKVSIEKLAYTLTEADVKEAIQQEQIRAMLGIYTIYDSGIDNNIDAYIPSMYNSLDEYEADKSEADIYIHNNKQVPEQLAKKLIAARIELENKGILAKCTR